MVVVENRPGAGGAVGMEAVAKAAPDGYTLGSVNTGDIIGKFLHKGLSFDATKDLVPVAMIGEAPQLLAISAHVPAKTFQDFLAYAQRQSRQDQLRLGRHRQPDPDRRGTAGAARRLEARACAVSRRHPGHHRHDRRTRRR